MPAVIIRVAIVVALLNVVHGTTPCMRREFTNADNPGSCHFVYQTIRGAVSVDIPVFDSITVPDIPISSPVPAVSFRVTVEPSMCYQFYRVGGNVPVTTSTLNELVFSGEQSISDYRNAIAGLHLRTCVDYNQGSMRVYDLVWDVKFRVVEYNNHYYWPHGSQGQPAAITTCNNFKM
eukprot:PhM_4_TR2081/c0_g1_i4/m.72225